MTLGKVTIIHYISKIFINEAARQRNSRKNADGILTGTIDTSETVSELLQMENFHIQA